MPSWLERWIVRGALAGSFAIPLGIGVLAASPEPYWLDSPEFTAAAQTLGIPHPPGHPLWVMLVKPFTLLPIGGIALRVALASAVFGALASLLLFKLTDKVIERACPELPTALRACLSLAAALIAAVAPGWWFQCVRAEVYSLQILLVLAALYPLVTFCLSDDQSDDRPLYVAALFFGLGLCNHHFITLCALPAAIPPLVWLSRTRGGTGALKTSAKLAVVATVGLLPYAFLPLRSAVGAPVALGGVHSPAQMAWVVSARAYQKSMLREHGETLGQRSLDAMYTMMGELGPVLVVAAVAGLYLMLRKPATRMTGLVLTLLIGITVLLRAIMGFDPFNPDYYGYMLPAVAGLTVAAATFAGIALMVIRRGPAVARWIATLLALGVLALPVLRAREVRDQVDLSDFNATRLMLDFSLEQVEPGSLVLASYYKLFFVLWSARYIDGSRPDVTVVNPHFFGYPGYLEATLSARPDLRKLAWSMVVSGKITEEALADLALAGPLRVEPDPWLHEDAARYLLPDGPVYEASPEPLALSDVRSSALTHAERWERFYTLLGPAWEEHETWRMLSWCHYLDALFLARRGDRKGALEAVSRARALANEAEELLALEDALSQPGSGPLDIESFLPPSAAAIEEKDDLTPGMD
ncbi:MAG: DUF2723 domain-containing protein [Deltaproteobacteria bacterium]|nr:DUF2723 domain-containing protein [Deltaproteobacteria bacterium]